MPTRRADPVPPMAPSRAGPVFFIRQFLRDAGTIGAVARSSRALALNMVKGMDLEHAKAVAELGPGTGAFTRVILERIPPAPECRFFAVEKNPAMAAAFRATFPHVPLHEDDAQNLRAISAAEGVPALDAIVSGLPFMSFPEALQESIVAAAAGALKPGGRFATFTYRIDGRGRARRFRALLGRHFRRVTIGGLTLMNVPPAVVFRCAT